MEQLVEVNLNVVSLRTLVQQLLDGNKELKDAHKENEYPFNLENLKLMESLSEKNSLLDNSLSDLTVQLKWLREKIKGLEECCESLPGNTASHASESNVMAFHAEAIAKNIRKLSEKTALFENSLSDATFEFEGLREKVKALEESCNSLYHQNCYLIAENNNLAAQVEKIEQHMESLDNRFLTFEGKHLNMDNEDMLNPAKEDHENHALFFKNQACALIDQISILKEKNQLINEELEDWMHQTVKSGIDCFITKQILYDMNEKNLILSHELQMYMNKLSCAEDSTLELKHVQSTQEKKRVLLLEENKKLLEWVHTLLKAFEAEEYNETSNGGYKNMVQFISPKMMDLQALLSNPGEEFLHIHLEKSPFIILLEQLGLSLVELRARKYVLEQESEKKNEEILLLHGGSSELMEVNELLRRDLNACNQKREHLMSELEALRLKLSDLQEAQSTFHGEIPKSFAESECISSKSFELMEQTVSHEEEHDAILEEFMIHENLSYNFRSSDTEKSSGIDQLINDVYNLHGITNDLGQDLIFLNENMRALQSENMHPRDMAVDFETRNSAFLEDDVDKVSEVFENRIMEWSDTHQRFQNIELENTNMFVDVEALMMELNKANMVREELEKKILLLSKENVHKDDENEFLRQSNEKLAAEISRLSKDAEALRRREKKLTSELQTAENRMEDLMKQVDILLKENKELEGKFPLLLSLNDDIGSLEEHSVSLENDHILSNQREQGDNLSATHHVSEATAGIIELEKLHGKVKQLQKTVTNAEKLIVQEEIVNETTLVSQTRKIKARRSKRNKSPLQLETEKKKDVILDLRKTSAADKDVRQLEIDQEVYKVKHEQMLKEIELDHVRTEEQAREMFEPLTNHVKEHHKTDIMAGETSVNPSSELILEKELDLLESHHEWCSRIRQTLSSDTLRLCILQENLEELKKNMEASDMRIQFSSSASNSITEQIKISALVVEQLIDINFILTEMADKFYVSLDGKEGKRQVSERVQIASKKIDLVELELENIEFILPKLMEEGERKALKTLQSKSRFPLKGFMYWKSNVYRKKRRRFCACIRFKNNSD